MSNRKYLAVSGTIFLIVAVAHIVRVVENWSVQVNQWSVPMEVSWVGAIVTSVLAIWSFRLFCGSWAK